MIGQLFRHEKVPFVYGRAIQEAIRREFLAGQQKAFWRLNGERAGEGTIYFLDQDRPSVSWNFVFSFFDALSRDMVRNAVTQRVLRKLVPRVGLRN